MGATSGRPALHLVTPLEHEAPAPRVSFCGHCGAHPAAVASSRVCGDCGLGLILESRADVAPKMGDAFLVLDRSLAVCAVSEAAERLLATTEPDAVNRHVTALLMPANAEEKHGSDSFDGRGLGRSRRQRHTDHPGPPGQYLRDPPDRADHQLRPAPGRVARVGIVRNCRLACAQLQTNTENPLTAAQ